MSGGDAKTNANQVLTDDVEAQEIKDILTQLGLALNIDATTGCKVDQSSMSSAGLLSKGISAQQTSPGMTYTQTPVGTNGILNIAQGVNSENNVWFSWKQLGTNNVRKKITHVELFGDQAALQTALAQHKALGVQFTVLDEYNKRRLIHQLAQYTTLKTQGVRTAGAVDEYGLPVIEALQLDGRLLDVKNAKAVIVNEHVSPTSSSQLIGEVLIALPTVANSNNGSPNFDLDDTLFLRIPVNASTTDELWKIGIVQNALPPPLDQPKVWIPVASFNFSPQQPRFGQTVQFDASASSDVDGKVVDYIWAFGDGTTSQGQASVSHLYAQPGSYQVSLTVVDNDGQSSQPATSIVNVAALVHPLASFTYSPTQPTTGQAVQFNGSASSDADGTVVNYNWTFGDGSTAQGQATLSHTYATAGSFQASLTVVDNDGQSSAAATVTIAVVLPGPPAGQLRVRITGTSSTAFQIQVVGYSSWTPRHNFKIDMLMSTNVVNDEFGNPTTNTSGFTSATATVTGDAAATVTQYIASGPHLEGAVGTGTVSYNFGMVSNVDYVRFTIRLDMDGDGIYEVGPTPVPIYVTVGTDTRRVVPTGTVTEFMLRKSTGMLLAFNWLNLKVCSSTGTNCVVPTVSAAASSMMGSAAADRSLAVVSTKSEPKHSKSSSGTVHALNDPIILDPDILDYWKTELAVPTAVDLATTSVKEVTRDNFYNNYTTEKVDALDIRAFARWGRDFDETFTYCPYDYYDELAPFKRVLCTGYFDLWYNKAWEKGVAFNAALNSYNTLASVDGSEAVLHAWDSQSRVFLAGFHNVTKDKVEQILTLAKDYSTRIATIQPNADPTAFQSRLTVFTTEIQRVNSSDLTLWLNDLLTALNNGQWDQKYSSLLQLSEFQSFVNAYYALTRNSNGSIDSKTALMNLVTGIKQTNANIQNFATTIAPFSSTNGAQLAADQPLTLAQRAIVLFYLESYVAENIDPISSIFASGIPSSDAAEIHSIVGWAILAPSQVDPASALIADIIFRHIIDAANGLPQTSDHGLTDSTQLENQYEDEMAAILLNLFTTTTYPGGTQPNQGADADAKADILAALWNKGTQMLNYVQILAGGSDATTEEQMRNLLSELNAAVDGINSGWVLVGIDQYIDATGHELPTSSRLESNQLPGTAKLDVIFWSPNLGGYPALVVANTLYTMDKPQADHVETELVDWVKKADKFVRQLTSGFPAQYTYKGREAGTGILVIVVKGPGVTTENMSILADEIKKDIQQNSINTPTILTWKESSQVYYSCLFACSLASDYELSEAACILNGALSGCGAINSGKGSMSGVADSAGLGPVPIAPRISFNFTSN